jgi:NAD(P)-dependent dehydrogenase (short-subunit alcohol dehydrogenase family)
MVRDRGGEMVSMAPIDISTEAGATTWMKDAVAAFGRVDILYNNVCVANC